MDYIILCGFSLVIHLQGNNFNLIIHHLYTFTFKSGVVYSDHVCFVVSKMCGPCVLLGVV